ncbi:MULTISPECIES: chlorophyll a/b-binding protein [Cyanophyceae]
MESTELRKSTMQSSTDKSVLTPTAAPAFNGKDRNAWLFGWTPQAELWNGRLAMIGFVAYLLWDLAGYSVVRLLHLAS